MSSKQQLTDYQVCHVIGSGSFGTCYKVRHKSSNKFYVWKVIDYGEMSEEKKKLLVSEVNVLSELNSKYIVKYHDRIIEPKSTTLYIIMEYCPGGDLATLIKKCQRTEQFLEEKFIWKVLYQLSVALQVCHMSGEHYHVLHRDIKPANVFLDENKNVKLGDFGLARVMSWDESHSNTLVGTPYYMSPEVIQGGKYNLKSDIWALGCLIYELCSFRPPFHGDNIHELTQQILDKGFYRIPVHYSEDLHLIVLYMLSKNDDIRPSIENLLRHPLVLKYTRSFREPSDFKVKVPSEVGNERNTLTSARTAKEIIANENCSKETMEDNAHVKNFKINNKNIEITEIVPNKAVCSNMANNSNIQYDYAINVNKGVEYLDEIYGTSIDNDTFLCETDGKYELDVNRHNSEEANIPAVENPKIPPGVDIPTKDTRHSVQTKINITYTQKTRNETNTGIRTRATEENLITDYEQTNELAQNQLSLIRQIYNSKMHMKDVLGRYSSEENIYMNNKSLPRRLIDESDDNNNKEERNRNVKEGKSNEFKNVLAKNSYLETAIDNVIDNENQQILSLPKLEMNFNNKQDIQPQHPPVNGVDEDIMERYQQLEDKINKILATQSRNEEIKSNHLSDLEILLHEKLDRIRHHEAYIKNKEKQLQNLELNLNKRERNLGIQERMIQETIQRAQVYLKQCKDSRRNLGLRTPIQLELKSLKENMKLGENFKVNDELGTVQEIEKDQLARNFNSNQISLKISKTSLPMRKRKEPGLENMRRHSTVDNDSSLSADPGDTSILPTMCKIDPDKVKPIKHYRHVHFQDEFIELFNDIDEMCHNRNKSTLEIIHNNQDKIHVGNSELKDQLTNKIMPDKYLNTADIDVNKPSIPPRQSSILGLRKPSTNTNVQMNNISDRKLNMTSSHPSTSSMKLSHEKTSIPHRTKQVCTVNHNRQRHSVSDIKLFKVEEERKPLTNIFENNNLQIHSRSSGLVGPGFMTSTVKNLKGNQIKSAKIKSNSMLPIGRTHSHVQMHDQENGLTGMRKHFVKSKTSQTASNSNVQQWMRKSMRNKENLGQGRDIDNRNKENTLQELHDKRIFVNEQDGFNLKQLNPNNLELVRKHLQPLTVQHYLPLQNCQSKSNFKDILKTRYADLALSPLTSEMSGLDLP